MENISQKQEIQNGWNEVTDAHAASVAKFVSENGFWTPEKPLKYGHLSGSEIEFSGGSKKKDEIVSGRLMPSEVKIYYENGQPIKLHAYFDGLDVLITGKAFHDYLDQVEE